VARGASRPLRLTRSPPRRTVLDLTTLAIPPWDLVVRSVVIYLVLLLGLRLFGKREVGQMTLFDLVVVLLVANAVQPAMTGPDNSLFGGLLIIGTLLSANWVVGRLRVRSPVVRRLLEPHATVLATDGAWLQPVLAHQGLDQSDVDTALREHGFNAVSETRLVVLEPDGSISVVPGGQQRVRVRRRVRTILHP